MTNNELKYYENLKQKKYRNSENKFLIEGVHLIEECLKSKLYKDNIEIIFARKDSDYDSLFKKIKGYNKNIKINELVEKKFNKLSETVNSQGIIAAVNKLKQNTSIDFSNSDLLIVATDNINDPGNLGTIIRTCYWFGVSEVLISKNSVDIYNSKVIRSSQGAIFNLNIRHELDLKNELERYYKEGVAVYLADAKTNVTLDTIKNQFAKKKLIVFGNEANGISEEILSNKNYTMVKIKGFSECESLNVAVTAGIILNELK